jgi:undecaprenyl-diphosphatase
MILGALDHYLFGIIFGLAHRNVFADTLAVFLARWVPYLLVIGFFTLLFGAFRKGKERLFYFIQAALIGILGRGVITELIRFFSNRPRPFEVLGFDPLMAHNSFEPSFPSGHAAFYFGLALAAYFMDRKWGIMYFVLASLIGIARIFVGVHWPLDVVIGTVIGIATSFAVRALLAPYHPKTAEALKIKEKSGCSI